MRCAEAHASTQHSVTTCGRSSSGIKERSGGLREYLFISNIPARSQSRHLQSYNNVVYLLAVLPILHGHNRGAMPRHLALHNSNIFLDMQNKLADPGKETCPPQPRRSA